MDHPALEAAGRWVELGLSIETEISGRALTDWYVGLGGLWLSNVLNSALPPWRLRPDTRLEYQDPVSHMTRYVGIFLSFGKSEVFCQHSVGVSVGVVPHVDVFLMYLWGGRWSPRLTPPPSWRSPCNRRLHWRSQPPQELEVQSHFFQRVCSLLFFFLFLCASCLFTGCFMPRPHTWHSRLECLVRNGCADTSAWWARHPWGFYLYVSSTEAGTS